MIDTVPPITPAVTTISEDSGISDQITNDRTLILGGTAEAGSTVELRQAEIVIGTAIADGSGNWLFDYTGTPLTDGIYQFTAALTDAVGNVATSAALAVTIDATAPTVTLSSNASAEVNAPFTVTAQFSEKVTGFDIADLSIQNGTVSDFVVTSDTTYRFLVTPTNSGVVTVDLAAGTAQDIAANPNLAAPQLSRIYDLLPPATPPTPVLEVGNDTGVSNTDGIIKDSTPTLIGTAEAGSKISLFVGTTILGTTTTDAAGNWSFTPSTPLADGNYAIGVTATDRLGNVSAASGLLSLQIDTKPATGVIVEISPTARDSSIDSDLSAITLRFSEPVANFNLADLKLTVDGQTIELIGATLTTTDNITWTLNNLTSLATLEGEFKLALTKGNIIDQAGNALEDGANQTWLVGRTGLALPEISFKGGKPGVKRKGGNGADTLRGTWLNDTLQGMNGNDILISGAADFSFGRDRLVGGQETIG
jgi:large repetitive protein